MQNIIWLAACAISCVLCGRTALLYYQLESYQFGGYLRTLKRNTLRAFLPGMVSAVCAGVCLLIYAPVSPAVLVIVSGVGYFFQTRIKEKKPLKITARVKRLLTVFLLLGAALAAVPVYIAKLPKVCAALTALTPVWLLLAALLVFPLEKLIWYLYLRDGMRTLDKHPDLIKIGITGSYGKTSCKFMLETILSEKYRVLVTPASFNTSMGVTRIIRERLAPDHQVFVAEMGARHPGDIRILCRLVRPQFGIITSVGPQHLETFHTQESICKEKFELARHIKKDGGMVFASDGGLVDKLFEKAKCPAHLSGNRHEGKGLYATNIETGPWGSRFLLCNGERSVPCTTRLLGAHNISNLMAAGTMASLLGLDLETIARGISKCRPVDHRLQLLSGTGGVTVIDDAFNANPVGANAALDVLSGFKSGRRIIVTPGFVELGEKEEKYNHDLGVKIAGCADIAVLVGKKHTAPIAQGIRESGFAQENLVIVPSLADATAYLNGILLSGDTLLYENDLPDNYRE